MTLAERYAAQRSAAARPAPPPPAPSPRATVEQSSPSRVPDLNFDASERRLGYTDAGDQIPMSWPADADGKAWEAARHGLASELAIFIDVERAWIACLRAGHDPILIAGPFKTLTAPF